MAHLLRLILIEKLFYLVYVLTANEMMNIPLKRLKRTVMRVSNSLILVFPLEVANHH